MRPPTPPPPPAYIGRVTRVDGGRCHVEIPALGTGYEYGPARYPAADVGVLAVGDAVAVTFVDGGSQTLVVLVRLT